MGSEGEAGAGGGVVGGGLTTGSGDSLSSASGTDTQFHRTVDGLDRYCDWNWAMESGRVRAVICGVEWLYL